MYVFQRLARMASWHDYEDLVTLLSFSAFSEGTYDDSFIVSDVVLDLFKEQARKPHNQALLAKLRERDMTEDEIVEYDKRHLFQTEDIAVARKLTMMWTINPRFVADKRLLGWLYEALDV